MCDLPTLQEREILRNDRALGLGRDQFTRIHAHLCPYDLTVDTTARSAFDCAQEILHYIRNTPEPKAFKQISEFT
jgi:chloramphenicol 3-O-phosphotransferase